MSTIGAYITVGLHENTEEPVVLTMALEDSDEVQVRVMSISETRFLAAQLIAHADFVEGGAK